MSGYRVDHMSHQIETTWDNPDGTPYTANRPNNGHAKPKVSPGSTARCGPWTGATTNKGTQHE